MDPRSASSGMSGRYFGIGTKNVELLLGHGWFAASFEIRWNWS